MLTDAVFYLERRCGGGGGGGEVGAQEWCERGGGGRREGWMGRVGEWGEGVLSGRLPGGSGFDGSSVWGDVDVCDAVLFDSVQAVTRRRSVAGTEQVDRDAVGDDRRDHVCSYAHAQSSVVDVASEQA